MKQATFVTGITVTDPDTGADVHLDVFKHQNGGMFAMDSSYLEQGWDDDRTPKILDPFDIVPDESKLLELIDAPEID